MKTIATQPSCNKWTHFVLLLTVAWGFPVKFSLHTIGSTLETCLKTWICSQHSLSLHGSFSKCFTNESSGSGGICQWLSSWWWCILKNEIWGHSGADPASMYKCGLWVRTFDRFRITLIMWNWRLLIGFKSPTNKNACLENSEPIGNVCVKTGKKKGTLIYRTQFSFLFLFFSFSLL